MLDARHETKFMLKRKQGVQLLKSSNIPPKISHKSENSITIAFARSVYRCFPRGCVKTRSNRQTLSRDSLVADLAAIMSK